MQGVSVRRKGFTLLELVVVIAIVGILSGIAVPAFEHAMTTSRMQAAAYQLAGDLKLMRENAVLYQADLTMYFCTNPTADRTFYCFELLPRLDSTTGLPRDYLHYNPPTDGEVWPDPGRFLRRDFPYAVKLALPKPFTYVGYIGSREYYKVTFYCGSGGHFRGQPSAYGTVKLMDQTGAHNWYVIVDSVGRVRVSAQPPAS
jgi:prepilin-type N-terminal cleavage/methylation domain-containing protein